MARRNWPTFDWRRWLLGGRSSWRRVVLAGIGGGVALALVAALVASMFGGGSGSLDDEEPTATAPVFVPVDDEPIATLPPVDVAPSPTPTLMPALPTEAPPTDLTPVPSATVVAPVATPTLVPEPTPTFVPEEASPTPDETLY